MEEQAENDGRRIEQLEKDMIDKDTYNSLMDDFTKSKSELKEKSEEVESLQELKATLETRLQKLTDFAHELNQKIKTKNEKLKANKEKLRELQQSQSKNEVLSQSQEGSDNGDGEILVLSKPKKDQPKLRKKDIEVEEEEVLEKLEEKNSLKKDANEGK